MTRNRDTGFQPVLAMRVVGYPRIANHSRTSHGLEARVTGDVFRTIHQLYRSFRHGSPCRW